MSPDAAPLPALYPLHANSPVMVGMRPVNTPIPVCLNTVDHIAPVFRLRHGCSATVIGIAESGAPELPHNLHLRLAEGEMVLDTRWVDFTDLSRVPVSHLGLRNCSRAWLIVTALQEAHRDNPYSRRYYVPSDKT